MDKVTKIIFLFFFVFSIIFPISAQDQKTVVQKNIDSPSGKTEAKRIYWQNAKTKKVHNVRCRYYQTSEGQMVSDLNGGTDCKICGGTGTGSYDKPKTESTKSSTSGSSEYNYTGNATIHTGPRGGRYYINSKGKKTYIRKKK